MKSNQELIRHLRASSVLLSPEIEQALKQVDRKKFIQPQYLKDAYADFAVPFADGQTISQPTTVVMMLELLDVKPGLNILDIGAGSGWVSCLLGWLAGPQGKVYAYEVNKKVAVLGKENVEKNDIYHNIEYVHADAAKVWSKNAPFDRIHAAAAFNSIPDKLLAQLSIGGVLVAPTQDYYMRKITRTSEDEFDQKTTYGFTFVPFISS